jgi:hypothetical protein
MTVTYIDKEVRSDALARLTAVGLAVCNNVQVRYDASFLALQCHRFTQFLRINSVGMLVIIAKIRRFACNKSDQSK